MQHDRVRLVVTSPLEDEFVAAIAAVDPRLEVIYPAELIQPARYPADHAAPRADTPEIQGRWRELLEGAEVLFDFGPSSLSTELPHWPRLRWIQATSAGVGQFAARIGLNNSQVIVTTASGVHARPLAEFALMSMLMFLKGAFHLAEEQRAHHWQRFAGEELAGKTVTLVGVGRIGREIARVCRTLDARVVGTVRTVGDRHAEDLFLETLLPYERLDQLLPGTDFLVLACPHTPDTEGLISAARLAMLRPSTVVINVARGAVIDEEALIEALRTGKLRGAALDVFAREPLRQDSPLWDLPNVLVSPHSASTAASENGKIIDLFVDNLHRYLEGRPLRNVLDKSLLY